MTRNVLIADDEAKMRTLLQSALTDSGLNVFTAADGVEALAILQREEIDLVISDWRMPRMDGPQLMAEIKKRLPELPVIIMTAYDNVKDAVLAIRNGAYDYIGKPFDIDELELTAKNALRFRDVTRDNARLRAELDERLGADDLIGSGPAFRQVLAAVDAVADSGATVLLAGESGTGKEMVARALHRRSGRADKPFVTVNCAAIPEGLLESEMFGHRKGSFTGAVADRVGRFVQADQGTLFLDEVGDMPLALQAKMLRALQERVIEPVGDPRSRKVDVRVIAATNKDLLAAVRDKEFREDLYYRLNVFPIALPPLRRRLDDIPALAAHFVRHSGIAVNKRITGFTPAALHAMAHYAWPGNIRELQNCIERAAIVGGGSLIDEGDLPPYLFLKEDARPAGGEPSPAAGLDTVLAEFERRCIVEALRASNGVQAAAASKLGISERSLWYRLKKLGISVERLPRSEGE